MGNYPSNLVNDSEDIHKSSDPKQPDWIIKHAQASGCMNLLLLLFILSLFIFFRIIYDLTLINLIKNINHMYIIFK